MLKKILLAVDGSENAEKALPWVKQYAARQMAEVVLLRVVRPEETQPQSLPGEMEGVQKYLGRIERELNYAGVPCKVLVRKGNPARVIVRAADRERCDLILMSTRGGSGIERWMMGSVTEQVLRLSPIPVLVVRSRTTLPRQGHVRRVIVPVDGSKLAETALGWSEKLAKLLKAKVIFLHVYPPGRSGLRARYRDNFDALNQRMTRECGELRRKGLRASFNVQRGDPADRILAFADRNDLIVTTTHGRGGFKRWIFGSVAQKLIHDGGIPVLVFKTPAQT
jgi:nucleotide-binding universal stress UspA family protein